MIPWLACRAVLANYCADFGRAALHAEFAVLLTLWLAGFGGSVSMLVAGVSGA